MRTEAIRYRGADVGHCVGFLARPAEVHGSAVLLAHNAIGLSDFERGVAVKLARAGHIVLCADYIGGGELLGMEDIGPRLGRYIADPSRIRPLMLAALEALVAQPGVDAARIAAIGYCFGGAAAFELACTGADIAAVVGFHSTLPSNCPDDARRIRGKVLMQQGAQDPLVTADDRLRFESQMKGTSVDWRIHLLGGAQHAFTLPGVEAYGMQGAAYDEVSQERSWRAMLDLFGETIDRGGEK